MTGLLLCNILTEMYKGKVCTEIEFYCDGTIMVRRL